MMEGLFIAVTVDVCMFDGPHSFYYSVSCCAPIYCPVQPGQFCTVVYIIQYSRVECTQL